MKLLLALAYTMFMGNMGVTEFTVKHDGVKINWELPTENEKGSMNGLEATIIFDPADLTNSKIIAKVDPSSNETGKKMRDKHLSGSDFFDVKKYPEIIFTSTAIEADGDNFLARGELKMKGTTNQVEIPFSLVKEEAGSIFKGVLKIKTSDVGIDYKKIADSDEPNCIITIEVPVN